MGKLIFSIFLVLIMGIIINLLIPEHFIIKNVMFILLCIIAFYMVKNMDSNKVKKNNNLCCMWWYYRFYSIFNSSKFSYEIYYFLFGFYFSYMYY